MTEPETMQRVKTAALCDEPEVLARIPVSQEPVRITQLVDMISAAVNDPGMKKPNVSAITNWLLEKGFLEKQMTPDGKSRRAPTANGLMLGLSTQIRQSQYGEYQAIYYSPQAQQFVLDNLMAMLSE